MIFRESFTIDDVGLEEGQTFEFKKPPLWITVRRPPKGEDDTLKERQCICTATTEEIVSLKVTGQFIESSKNVYTQDEPPEAVRQISLRVASEITDFVHHCSKLIRWRVGITSRHSPIVCSRGFVWSEDGQSWHPVAGFYSIGFKVSPPYSRMSDAVIQSVHTLFAEGHSEPIAHDLLLEAFDLEEGSPRSSLLIAMAAAEIGFKAFVSFLIPDAAWLAMNAPTPPLVTMLLEYLPTLRVKEQIGGVPPFVPKVLLDSLRKGVKLRNEAAHAAGIVRADTLREILFAVRDLLYLLDVYAGHEWAYSRVSGNTRKCVDDFVSSKRPAVQ